MNNQLIGTIRLSGQDAREFAKSLFRPTNEDICRRNAIIEQINNSVVITRNEDGFQAEIEGLDLSFLEKRKSELSINIDLTVKVDSPKVVYSSGDRCTVKTVYITEINNECCNKPNKSDLFVIAA